MLKVIFLFCPSEGLTHVWSVKRSEAESGVGQVGREFYLGYLVEFLGSDEIFEA